MQAQELWWSYLHLSLKSTELTKDSRDACSEAMSLAVSLRPGGWARYGKETGLKKVIVIYHLVLYHYQERDVARQGV